MQKNVKISPFHHPCHPSFLLQIRRLHEEIGGYQQVYDYQSEIDPSNQQNSVSDLIFLHIKQEETSYHIILKVETQKQMLRITIHIPNNLSSHTFSPNK